jgi:hypothetical protein
VKGVIVRVVADAQLIAGGGQQLHRVKGGVENNRDIGVVGQLLQQAAVEGGLTRTHLAGQQDETPTGAHAIEQVRQGVPVTGAHEQVAGVYRYRERGLGEAEILVINGILS